MAVNKSNKMDNKKKANAGQNALKRLGKPVKGRILFAQFLTALSGILSIAPYVALTEIGRLLILSFQSGVMRSVEIWHACRLLIIFFSLKTFLYFASHGHALCRFKAEKYTEKTNYRKNVQGSVGLV